MKEAARLGTAFRHPGFANWVIGYQGFIEPIVRASLNEKLSGAGYLPLERRVVGRADIETAQRLLMSEVVRGALTTDERKILGTLLSGKTRLQLDLAYTGANGVAIGEIKSWGGWGAFDLIAAKGIFENGRDALLFLIDEVQGQPVERVILAVWGCKPTQHSEIVRMLEDRYGRTVDIEYFDDLLRTFPPKREIEAQQLRLRETYEDVSAWLDAISAASD